MRTTEMKRRSEYTQSVTLYFEEIEKAGISIGQEKMTNRPCLILTSTAHPFLAAILKSDPAVVEEMKRFVEWTSAKWAKVGDQKWVNVFTGEELKRRLAAQKDEIPACKNHLNVPVILKDETTEEKDCFLSVAFPSKEFLAMGGGQPKIIISRIMEAEARLDEMLDEMARWVAIRLAAVSAAA